MDPKREHHKILANQLIKNLAKRHMEGFYVKHQKRHVALLLRL